MAYEFERKATSDFQFRTNSLSADKTKLTGINATLNSAATICDGVNSLMAIGSNAPYYEEAKRTVTDIVYDN